MNPDNYLIITEVTQTCGACPSQWEGKLEDSRTFYVRYRWGYLSVCVSPGPTDSMDEAVRGEEVYGAQLGREFDGCLDWDEVLRRSPLIMSESVQRPEGDDDEGEELVEQV